MTISNTRAVDTGLYMWELSYREEDGSERFALSAQKVLLLVEETGLWFASLTFLPSRFNPRASVKTLM